MEDRADLAAPGNDADVDVLRRGKAPFAKRDLEPLTPGEIAEITFDLYPISYRVRAGHAIRVSIAGADVDHFTRIPAAPAPAPTLTIHRDAAHPSRLILPVMP